MAWVAVTTDGEEYIFACRQVPLWLDLKKGIKLSKGSIKKLIGRELSWSDEPVRID
jgi:hypothetical protein